MTGLSTDDVVAETDGLPTFDLGYRYDDADDPDEVTVFDATAEETVTSWITASVEDTVSLDRIA